MNQLMLVRFRRQPLTPTLALLVSVFAALCSSFRTRAVSQLEKLDEVPCAFPNRPVEPTGGLPYRYEYTLRTFREWSKNDYQFGAASVCPERV
jgi:hypothetical protein